MISAPLMGCAWSSFASRASAGGQLEHPSEVKSSTRTGGRLVCGVCAAPGSGKEVKANKAAAMAKERSGDMKSTSGTLEPRSRFKLHPDKRISMKQLE